MGNSKGKGKSKGKAKGKPSKDTRETVTVEKELHVVTTSEEQRPNRQRPPLPTSPYPWLVYHQGEERKKQMFYDVYNGRLSEKSVPELKHQDYPISSSFGWLVLMGNYDPAQRCLTGNEGYYLWNPVTSESIPIPPLQLKPEEFIIGMQLSSPPEHPDCAFVMFVYHPWGIVFCRINDKDQKWVRRDCSKEIKKIENYRRYDDYRSPVVCNDRIYSPQTSPRVVFEIEIEKVKPHKVNLTPTRCTEPKDASKCIENWVEFCGDVFCIQIEPGIGEVVRDIAVLKLDLSDKMLKDIKSFPDKVFFADPFNAFCCPAQSENMGSKVFFTLSGNKVLFTYNVEDQSISTTVPFPGVAVAADLRPLISWMLPSMPPSLVIAEKKDDAESGILPGDGTRNQEEKVQTVSRLEELPEGLVSQVLKFLDPFEYLSFRSVSKRCQLVAPTEQLAEICRLEECNSTPWLFLPVIHKRVISIVDPRFGGELRSSVTIPPEVPKNARIHYAKHGWLLMSSAGDRSVKSLFLYNPLSGIVRPLPELQMEDYRDTDDFFFLSSPMAFDFMVVAINYLVVFAVIVPEAMTEWKVFDVPLVGYRLSVFHSNHVFIGDTLYYLTDWGNLNIVRVKDPEDFFLTAYEVEIPSSSKYKQSYLVACDEELLAVHVGEAGKWVKVFKLKRLGTGMVWVAVKDLGNKCLYVSKVSSFSVDSEVEGKKNRIYFGRFFGESVIYYSMDTCKFHYSLSREGSIVEETLNSFESTNEHLHSCWFDEPKWKLIREPTDPASSVMTDKLASRIDLSLIDRETGSIRGHLFNRELSQHHQLRR